MKTNTSQYTAEITSSTIAIGALLFYGLMDAIAPRGVFQWRITFAVTFIVVTLSALKYFRGSMLRVTAVQIYAITMSCVLIYGVLSLLIHQNWSLVYIIGDFAIISFLIISIPIAASIRQKINRFNALNIAKILVIFSCISLLSSRFDFLPAYNHGIRFDAPHIVAMALLGASLAYPHQQNNWNLYILITATLVLSWLSQWRAELLFVSLAVLPAIVSQLRRHPFVVLPALGVVAVTLNYSLPDNFTILLLNTLEQTRFRELVTTQQDVSFANRILEAQDVLYVFQNDVSIWSLFFGHGHGAAFEPIFSYPEPNLRGGRVHNIHIHYFLWLFRYGYVGVLCYLTFSLIALRGYVRALVSKSYSYEDTFLGILGGLIVTKSIFYSVINDPLIAVSITAISIHATSWSLSKKTKSVSGRTRPSGNMADYQ